MSEKTYPLPTPPRGMHWEFENDPDTNDPILILYKSETWRSDKKCVHRGVFEGETVRFLRDNPEDVVAFAEEIIRVATRGPVYPLTGYIHNGRKY